MKLVHTIRLREPWETLPLPEGPTEYRRRFGQPRLSQGEMVWLVCPDNSTVRLNGEPVDVVSDVTSKLNPRNELVIQSPDPPSDVRLEIRSSLEAGLQPTVNLHPNGETETA
jgi:hypothetical protein